MKKLLLLISHAAVGFAGFALGIYMLPILIATPSPSEAEMQAALDNVQYEAEFVRDLKGSDFLHWGEGKVSLNEEKIVFSGELAPGPDYKLYLSPVYVEDEQSFLANKADMVRVAEIKNFNGFVVDLPQNLQLDSHTSVIVWCETFSEFITAARFR